MCGQSLRFQNALNQRSNDLSLQRYLWKNSDLASSGRIGTAAGSTGTRSAASARTAAASTTTGSAATTSASLGSAGRATRSTACCAATLAEAAATACAALTEAGRHVSAGLIELGLTRGLGRFNSLGLFGIEDFLDLLHELIRIGGRRLEILALLAEVLEFLPHVLTTAAVSTGRSQGREVIGDLLEIGFVIGAPLGRLGLVVIPDGLDLFLLILGQFEGDREAGLAQDADENDEVIASDAAADAADAAAAKTTASTRTAATRIRGRGRGSGRGSLIGRLVAISGESPGREGESKNEGSRHERENTILHKRCFLSIDRTRMGSGYCGGIFGGMGIRIRQFATEPRRKDEDNETMRQ